jgi:hypothetical protein
VSREDMLEGEKTSESRRILTPIDEPIVVLLISFTPIPSLLEIYSCNSFRPACTIVMERYLLQSSDSGAEQFLDLGFVHILWKVGNHNFISGASGGRRGGSFGLGRSVGGCDCRSTRSSGRGNGTPKNLRSSAATACATDALWTGGDDLKKTVVRH